MAHFTLQLAMRMVFNRDLCEQLLQHNTLVQRIVHYSTVTSTMDTARELWSSSADAAGTLVIADSQTAAQGRGGRSWFSPSGALSFTLLMECKDFKTSSLVNLAVPVAVARACSSLGVTDVGVKWPNDVWIGNKKLCGVLVDIESSWKLSIGVGINLNNEIQNDISKIGVSLKDVLLKTLQREKVLSLVLDELELLLKMKFDRFLDAYSGYDILKNKQIIVMPKKIEDDSAHYFAKCIGVSSEGFLQVALDDGTVKTLLGEEVSVRAFMDNYK